MIQQALNELSERIRIRPRYDNFIGGQWVPPVKGQYFTNLTPITGKPLCEIARSTAEDIELALDTAHVAREKWARTSAAERAALLNKIADRMESNLKLLAMVETLDNGKPFRETMAADMPLAADHFRYFASCVRAQEGSLSEIDETTIAYHFHEPLGVVGQIIPWNFPVLMAAWKLAPALAAGNCVVLKPAEQTPMGIMVLMDLIGDILPPGVLNVVNGFGVEAGKPLAQNKRINKVAFTGETTTGRLIMQYASENIIPCTLELGGKSPNIFFADVADADDDYFDKALEGFNMFALNQGEVCTCPSRALVQEKIYDRFMERAIERTKRIRQGHPLDPATMIGAQASNDQMEKILAYIKIGEDEGAGCWLVASARFSMVNSPGDTTSSRPSSKATTRCVSSRRRSSDQFSPSRSSRTTKRHCRSLTTRFTDLVPASGPAMATAPTASGARFRRAACGPTATICIRRTRRSEATSSLASGVRHTR